MKDDPIVAEVRKARNEYAARFNYNLKAMARDLMSRERKGGRRLVTLPPKLRSAAK